MSLFGAMGCAMDGVDALDGAELEAQDRRVFNPIGNYNFKVEIDGVTAGYFKNVDGLSAELEIIELQADDPNFSTIPPLKSITLRNGYIVTPELQTWWRDCRDGKYDRRDISIKLGDNTGAESTVEGVWPTEWKHTGFDGKGNDVVTEEIVFAKE